MKSNSTISPSKVIESNEKIYIVDISSLEKVTKDEQVSYNYEMYELPIAKRDNLMEYIESNYDVLIGFAKEKEIERNKHVVTEQEKQSDMVNQLFEAYLAQFTM
jgi:hypothetical protein